MLRNAEQALICSFGFEKRFGYQHVNVMEQRRDPNSFLNWMERAIRVRKECPEFGWGSWRLINTNHPSVFAHCCEWRDGVVLAVHNLSDQACTVTLNLEVKPDQHLIDLLDGQHHKTIENVLCPIQMQRYGHYWFRIGKHRL